MDQVIKIVKGAADGLLEQVSGTSVEKAEAERVAEELFEALKQALS